MTFKAPDEAWLEGGNCRTVAELEPLGLFGDVGWYSVGAVLWAMDYALPERVQMLHVRRNGRGVLLEARGFLWFADGATGAFDCGSCTCYRSYFEVACDSGAVRVDDLVGGKGRSGADIAKDGGSASYERTDAAGRVQSVDAAPCDHTRLMIEDFTECVRQRGGAACAAPCTGGTGTGGDEWPRRSLATQRTLSALYRSAEMGCVAVELGKK